MDTFLVDWLNLLLRWAHLVLGIAWIGTSFHFIALDLQVRPRADLSERAGGVWLTHGGSFYDLRRFPAPPAGLPEDLVWYRWDAYLTWVSGFCLLAVQYYWNAGLYLIDPGKLALAPWQAVALSVAMLGGGWLAYDGLCRSPVGRHVAWLALAVFGLVMGAAALFLAVFSGRGAFIHVGVFVGTMMVANVFLVIIPNQRRMLAALLAGETPATHLGDQAKQRSTHNTYLTLPVLVMMVSNHYPFLHSSRYSLVVVAAILVSGGMIRHAMTSHTARRRLLAYWWAIALAALAVAAAVVVTVPKSASLRTVSDDRALELVQAHCVMCHARVPRHEAFSEPPKDVVLEGLADLRRLAPLMLVQVVQTQVMPLGNETGMTDDERDELGAWLVRALRKTGAKP